MLPGVGEVDAEQRRVAAGPGIADVGVQANDRAAERHRDVPVACVAAHERVVLAEVDRIVGPALAGDKGEVGRVTRHDGDELVSWPDPRWSTTTVAREWCPARTTTCACVGAPSAPAPSGRGGPAPTARPRARCPRGGPRRHRRGNRGRAVLRGQDPELTCLGEGDRRRRDPLGQLGRPRRGGTRPLREEGGELLHRGEAPLLLDPWEPGSRRGRTMRCARPATAGTNAPTGSTCVFPRPCATPSADSTSVSATDISRRLLPSGVR